MKSWRVPTGLLMVAVLAWPNMGSSSPEVGRLSEEKVTLPPGSPGIWERKIKFVGGERACVIIQGDHKPIVDVGIEIQDATGRVVAKDTGKGDLAAVVWYPPEDGEYNIVVKNPNRLENDCFVMIR